MIKDAQSLKGATSKFGDNIPVYDDGFGPLWIARSSIHTYGIIRARTFEDAFSICEDEFFTEADETIEELIEEYGYKREHVKIVLDSGKERDAKYPDDYVDGTLNKDLKFIRWETRETKDPDAWLENELFQDSYGFRPNGPNINDKIGHGIYSKDLSGDYVDRLTPKLLSALEITLQIEDAE